MGRFFVYAMMFVLVLICQVFASTPDSLRIWEKKIERRTPEDGDAWVQLGQAYLKAGKLRRAEKAFRKGIRYGELAEAYNGVGLVFSNWEHQERLAFYYFRRALGADPTFIEAQMNTARLRLKLEDSDAETALMEAIQMDSTYAPAYLMLAEWYFDSGYTDRMVALYGKYLDMRPDDLDAHFGLARTYLEQHQFRPTLKVAELVLQRNPDAIQFLPLAAQVYAVQGNADRALALFLAYIEALPEDERRLYEDPSLVAFLKDLEAFHNTPESEREAFLEAFWRKLDLTQVSGGKARRVEHYRRVWYARTYFSEKVKPWDRRGEVYIRFGEPDYRSRSNAV
ncbi:MAG: GWxTD domain-containing protein, partial [bacterium]|nr:GWxTD domain-containing protein [bacterium]